MIRRPRIGGMIGAAIFVVLLGGCTQTYAERELSPSDIALARPASPINDNELLAVRIRTFDPGKLPEDPDLAKGLSKEIRNAEAYYIPVQLKNTMQRSDHWGPVRVVPEGTRDGEVVVDGHILESDGEILRLAINVSDGTGNEWFSKEYTGVVNDEMYRRAEQQGVDVFQPLYNEIANDIAAYLQKLAAKDALMIRKVTELRFGVEFAPDVFNGYVQNTAAKETAAGPMQKFVSFFTSPSEDEDPSSPYRAVRLPSEDDPMVQRVNRIRAREEFLIDTFDQQYDGLARNISDGYTKWRESRLNEINAIREVDRVNSNEQMKAIVIGVLGVLAGAAIGSQKNCSSCGTTGAIVAGAAATIAVQKAVQASDQAEAELKLRKTALEELGQSLQSDVKPIVIEVEGKTVELKGTVEEKFQRWREVLKELRDRETGEMPTSPAPRIN